VESITTDRGPGGGTLLVTVAPSRARCPRCHGHGRYLPTVFEIDGSAHSGEPTMCDDCEGAGYR
jgi:hypothetical protein